MLTISETQTPNDEAALEAACLLLVQAHRAGDETIEALAAAAIAMIEDRASRPGVRP